MSSTLSMKPGRYRVILFRIDKGGDKFQRLWCKPTLELYAGLFCSVLLSWCQAAKWDLSGFLALRDYWTAWKPGKKICVTMLNNRQISLMHFCLYNCRFNKLKICPSKSRYESHPQKCYKMNLPTDEIVSSWLVSLLNCPVTYSCNLSPSVYEILH